MTLFQRVQRIIPILDRAYPDKGLMDMGTPEETLLATLLSAQTTDVQVLKIFPAFRRKFPSLTALAAAKVSDIASVIASINIYKTKAKHLRSLAQRIVEVYHGRVPNQMEDLLTLPGVGRKTASCVLWYAFHKPAVAVDTHVFRIAHRLGWAKGKNPKLVEVELRSLVPEAWWGEMNRTFVQFGRDVCKAGTPQCWRCPIREACLFKNKTKASVTRLRSG